MITKRRISRVIPFGWDLSETDNKLLIKNKLHFAYLGQAKKEIMGRASYRLVAEKLSKKTGRTITGMGLRCILLEHHEDMKTYLKDWEILKKERIIKNKKLNEIKEKQIRLRKILNKIKKLKKIQERRNKIKCKDCKKCKKPFHTIRKQQVYCSKTCYEKRNDHLHPIKNCKICNKEFKAKSPSNIVCADQECRRKNQYLCIKKYMKSEKGKIASRKSVKKQYEKNYVRLISTDLINGIYVKKYSNGETDIKITIHRECAKHSCNNTFYSIANENIELGKFDKKYCSTRCSENVRECTRLKDLKVLDPNKYREIREKENEKRRGKRTVANMTQEQIDRKNKKSREYRKSKKNCPIFEAKRKIRSKLRDIRLKYAHVKTKNNNKKLIAFEMSKQELKNISNLHRDHIEPLHGTKSCGLHVAENLQWLPSELNGRKSNMPFEEWQEICRKNKKEYTAILKNYNLKFNKEYITEPIAKVKIK